LIRMLSSPRTRPCYYYRPGGIGKTRLALEASTVLMAKTERCEESPNLAVFVALAEVKDAGGVADAISRSLGCRPVEDVDAMEQISAALASDQVTLLILDNFEHLSETAVLLVGELLARAPQLKCLVTSRHMLLLEGEHEFSLSPLPTSGNEQSNEEVLNSPSVSLFVDRAQMIRPNFQVTDSNAAVLAQICDRLEVFRWP